MRFTTNYLKIRISGFAKSFNRNVSRHSQKSVEIEENLIISCKRSSYNCYKNTVCNKLEEVILASKGWGHSKSKGDFFIVHPQTFSDKEDRPSFHYITHNLLADCLRRQNIYNASSFQVNAINSIKSGNHTLLAGETGCGKTIAYLLPIIENIKGKLNPQLNSPQALILVPNRELVYQIADVTQNLCDPLNLKVKSFVGGRTKSLLLNPQFSEMDIVVGTPGVISKLSTLGIVKLNNVQHTVIDEADTLLDDSFIERLSIILKRVIQSQLILVSATLPKKLPEFLKPIEPTLSQIISERIHMPLLTTTQRFLRLTKTSKPFELLNFAKRAKDPMIIFSNRNETCNWVALFLRENGIDCSNINGDMNYAIRIQQWNRFVRGENKILSATDICSRGLNTIQVTHVLNYDFPLYASDYIHRIGRTGRIGSPENCKITNFVAGNDEIKLVQEIETAIRLDRPIQNVDGNITNLIKKKVMKKIRE